MKKADVQIGGVYVVKVSGRLSPVKILRLNEYHAIGVQTWTGRNLDTGREVTIRSAARLRREYIAC